MGLRDVAHDVSPYIRPRLIVPPRNERDVTTNAEFAKLEEVPNVAGVLARELKGWSVLLDCEFLYADFGEATAARWLPKLFDLTRSRSVGVSPYVRLSDLLSGRAEAIRAAICSDEETRIAVALGEADLIDPGLLANRLDAGLSAVGVLPEQCYVIADFEGGEFEDPELAAGAIEGAIETLDEVGSWQRVAFLGTHYPLKNPAGAAEAVTWPRNVWKSWRTAVNLGPFTPSHWMFGDYAADHAKMDFRKGGARPHRCLRYTGADEFLVSRGPDIGAVSPAIRSSAQAIVRSRHFAGRGFSSADEAIHQISIGNEIGNPTNWRALNTCHHLTRVVRYVGSAVGISFSDRVFTDNPQLSLW